MKLPPFGKALSAECLEVYLFIGPKSWGKAMGMQLCRPGTLCLPPYVSPYGYTWPVEGKEILVFDTGWCDEDYIMEVVECLFHNKASIVRFVSGDEKLSVFKKGD